MSQKNFKLFVGVDEKRFSFTVIDTENEEDTKIVHTNQTPVTGVIENKITDPNEVYDILKTNTFDIERKLNCFFKEAILILDSFMISFKLLPENAKSFILSTFSYNFSVAKLCVKSFLIMSETSLIV